MNLFNRLAIAFLVAHLILAMFLAFVPEFLSLSVLVAPVVVVAVNHL
jgi:uncharacterized membrane protein (DUF485 family)